MDEFVRQLQQNLDEGLLSHLYKLASVSQDEVLLALREQGLEVFSIGEIVKVPPPLLDRVADRFIRQVSIRGAVSGASFGMGGFFSIAPEILFLVVTLLRLAQRLSLVYGHEFDSPKGGIDLWTSIGRGVGITIDLEGLESDLYRGLPMVIGRGQFRDPLLLKVAQKVVMAITIRMSTRVARMVPLVGAGLNSLNNYTWMTKIGRRLKDDFRTRHQLRHLNLSDPGLSEEIPFRLEDRQG